MKAVIFVPDSGSFDIEELPCVTVDGSQGSTDDMLARSGSAEVMLVSPATRFQQHPQTPQSTVEDQLGNQVYSTFQGFGNVTCSLSLDTNVLDQLYNQYRSVITHYHNYPLAVKQHFVGEGYNTFMSVEEIFDTYFFVTVIDGKLSAYNTTTKNLGQFINSKIVSFYKNQSHEADHDLERLILGSDISLSGNVSSTLQEYGVDTKSYPQLWPDVFETIEGTNSAPFQTDKIKEAMQFQQTRRAYKISAMAFSIVFLLLAGAAGYFWQQNNSLRQQVGEVKREQITKKEELQSLFRAAQLQQASGEERSYDTVLRAFTRATHRGLVIQGLSFDGEDGSFSGTARMIDDPSIDEIDDRAIFALKQSGFTIDNTDEEELTVQFSGEVGDLTLGWRNS